MLLNCWLPSVDTWVYECGMEHNVEREQQTQSRLDGQPRSETESNSSPAVEPWASVEAEASLDRSSTAGFSDITVEEYYARYLRQTYPYHDEEAIQETVQAAMRRPQVRKNLANMLKTELEILKDDPGWAGGWLRGELPAEARSGEHS